jgi:putative ABC transport system ATP-binding protein
MLQLKNLKKYYRMGETVVRALDGIDLDIKQGDFVAIMGASGSGKSTLMNILGCLDTPTGGDYVLNRKNVGGLDDDQLAAIRNTHLGFVFQSFNLLPRMTAKKNVALPMKYTDNGVDSMDERAVRMLDMVGLKGRMHHRPAQMSGGERQRVAIARALVNNPAVLLADEPTGNLDSATTREIMDIFTRLNRDGQTIVMVTHEDEVASYARRIVRLRDGLIIEDHESK